ncbi:ATS16-like protein, partial [Mya arenaria]
PAAFYMDVSNKAAFIVWRDDDTETDNFLFPPTSVDARHSVMEIEETSPTETDFLVNPDFDASRVEQMVASNAKDSDRVKRQETDYEVEIFFVIDYSLYSFWYMQMTGTDSEKQTSAISAIKQFYAFVLNAMSVRYISVTGSGYTISLVYAGISIATSSTDAPYIENNLQAFDVNGRRAFLATTVLSDFKDWGNTNLEQNYNYDVAMMFTSYEMGRTVNDEYNINEDHFGAVLATIAAHELGHNLDAQHDGTVDGIGELCSSDEAYVMAPSVGMSSDAIKNIRQFSFSSCSIDYFTAYITTLENDGKNCLATRTATYDTSDLDPYLGDLAGQVYTPDQQCEYLEGDGSYFSRISYESDYSGICSGMKCFVPGTTSSHVNYLAWEGTTCGDEKP